MAYTVSSIPLDPIPNVHSGTGTHTDRIWVVDPDSVAGSGALQFIAWDVQVSSFLFQLDSSDVPNWFGVAVPRGVRDFTHLHIFFHPLPAQAGYVDALYGSKGGLWKNLFYYMERLGYQGGAAGRDQVIVMPFLTQAAQDTGIFKESWQDICTQILSSVRESMGADTSNPLQIQDVAVSSFSVGIVYSNAFRTLATNLAASMREVWDFDGNYSTSRSLSQGLLPTPQYGVIKYDQVFSSDSQNFHVPQPRWKSYAAPPTNSDQVHGLIRDYMFLHAASISTVGRVDATTGTPVSTISSGSSSTIGSAGTASSGTSASGSASTGTGVETGIMIGNGDATGAGVGTTVGTSAGASSGTTALPPIGSLIPGSSVGSQTNLYTAPPNVSLSAFGAGGTGLAYAPVSLCVHNSEAKSADDACGCSALAGLVAIQGMYASTAASGILAIVAASAGDD